MDQEYAWWGRIAASRGVGEALRTLADEHPDRVVLTDRRDEKLVRFAAKDVAAWAGEVGERLRSAGVAPGDRVALFARNRIEWVVADAALSLIGAVSVPISPTAHVEHLRWVLHDAGASWAIVETEAQAERVEALGRLRDVWVIDDHTSATADRLFTRGGLHHLLNAQYVPAPRSTPRHALPTQVQSHSEGSTRRSLAAPATIVYSEGVTERPRGAVISHGALLGAVFSSARALSPISTDDSLTTLVFPSLSSMAPRVALWRALVFGAHVVISDPARVARDVEETSPHIVFGTPRFVSRVYEAARQRAHDAGKGRRFDVAEATLLTSNVPSQKRRRWKGFRDAVLDSLLTRRIRESLGSQLRWVILCGAAPERACRFFEGLGVHVLQGYGQNETCGVGTQNTVANPRFDTCGPPLDDVSLTLDDMGVLSMKGPMVFEGYMDESTTLRRHVDAGGWFATDVVATIEDGHLVVKGLSDGKISLASGARVTPGPLEEELSHHALVASARVTGEGETSVGVDIKLDAEACAEWLKDHGYSLATGQHPTTHPEVASALRMAIEQVNESVGVSEQIRRLRLLPTQHGQHHTPN